ncbi:transporter substrate-binding domain-containing protein [Anaerosinus massiliensis]|uniref:transporter substrate-binding domain-containing protein n=1 Tax=Massilibacillus massiliensis TaxID=1806837 RepID=UPI000DA60C6A|nr:transporter substrate-binding domain-containing protein [Massilibacillus massiliensis]
MYRNKWCTYFLIMIFLSATYIMAGCGLQEQKKVEENSGAAKTYYVGTRGTFKPYSYVNDKDQLTGFDIEILKEVEKRNKDIRFEFKTMSVSSAFVALEGNQIDIIANQMTHNNERDSKYYYTNEANNYKNNRITVISERNDIKTIEDLRGKKVSVTSTSPGYRILKEYNQTAEPKIEFLVTDKGTAETIYMVVDGKADATLADPITVKEINQSHNLNLKIVGKNITPIPTFFILRKNDENEKFLADKIDATVREMKQDGTLEKLSKEFLGEYILPEQENSK